MIIITMQIIVYNTDRYAGRVSLELPKPGARIIRAPGYWGTHGTPIILKLNYFSFSDQTALRNASNAPRSHWM